MVTIIAHRGASHKAPENTLLSFQKAFKDGVDAIEFDVHLTKDQIPVVIHDETVNRTTDGIGLIKNLTLNEIKSLNIDHSFELEFNQLKIPTLEEVFQWAEGKDITFNIELKTNKIHYYKIEEIVYTMTQQYNFLNKTIFSSFNLKSIKQLAKINNYLQLAFIHKKANFSMNELKEMKNKYFIEAIHCNFHYVHKKLIKRLSCLNLKLRPYTINNDEDLLKYYLLGVDGIITDCPKKLKSIISKYKMENN